MIYYCLTDKGKVRKSNEDYVFASDVPLGPLPNLFLVADGMGGQNAGDFASELSVRKCVEFLRSMPGGSGEENRKEALSVAISRANELVHRIARQDPEKNGMGTTLVAGVLDESGEDLLVANVGDSRLYVCQGGMLRQITLDHSFVEEMVRKGQLTREQARNHIFKNRITRAIGAERTVRIDFFQVELLPDARILLCSDGLTNMVPDERIRELMNEDRSVREISEALLAEALEAGGVDNITVIMIDMGADFEG